MPRTFVDTNVLAYAHDLSETAKQPIAADRVAELWHERTGALSPQVLREFYVVATRKYRPAMTHRQARALVAAYAEWESVPEDSGIILEASSLEERHSLSFWDAAIVAAALRAGATVLLTEDMQHGRRIRGLRIENPFGA